MSRFSLSDSGGTSGGTDEAGSNSSLFKVTVAASCLSMIGSLVIIALYRSYRKLRSFSVSLLYFLSIADFFAAVSNVLPDSTHGACQFQAVMQQFFFLSSFLWTFCCAVNQYLTVVRADRTPWTYLPVYHLFCWVPPGIITIALLATDRFGATGLWCWITAEYPISRWCFFYGPLLAVLLSVVVLDMSVLRALRNRARNDLNIRDKDVGRIQIDLAFYLLVFILVRTPSIVHRFIETVDGTEVYAVTVLHAIGSPLQGFVNGLLFVFNRNVRNFIRSTLFKRGPCAALSGASGEQTGGLASVETDDRRHSVPTSDNSTANASSNDTRKLLAEPHSPAGWTRYTSSIPTVVPAQHHAYGPNSFVVAPPFGGRGDGVRSRTGAVASPEPVAAASAPAAKPASVSVAADEKHAVSAVAAPATAGAASPSPAAGASEFPDSVPKDARFTVFVGSWNMAKLAPPNDISAFIPAGTHDIYAIGTQESDYEEPGHQSACARLCGCKPKRAAAAAAAVPNAAGTYSGVGEDDDSNAYGNRPPALTTEEHWFECVRRHVNGRAPLAVGDLLSPTNSAVSDTTTSGSGGGGAYDTIGALSMGGIRLIVLVRRHLLARIDRSTIQTSSEGTGIANLHTNKGAVGVAFSIATAGRESDVSGPECSFCFVNVHLAAHKNNIEARNEDLIQIVGRLKLGAIPDVDFTHQFHASFLFGDCNYRINLPTPTVLDCVRNDRLAPLIDADELTLIQRARALLYGFIELPIRFPPSYKFERTSKKNKLKKGQTPVAPPRPVRRATAISDQYKVDAGADAEEDKNAAAAAGEGGYTHYSQKRTPAWCDRVLWRGRTGSYIEQTQYDSIPAIESSDHKPVFASFRVGLHALTAGLNSAAATAAASPASASSAASGDAAAGGVVLSITESHDGKLPYRSRPLSAPPSAVVSAASKPLSLSVVSLSDEKHGGTASTGAGGSTRGSGMSTGGERATYEIVVSSLRVLDCRTRHDTAINEPYVTFRGEFMLEAVHSDALPAPEEDSATSSAAAAGSSSDGAAVAGRPLEWSAAMIPRFYVQADDLVLGTKAICLVVRDRSLFGTESEDMAQGVIELRAPIQAMGVAVPFDVPLTHQLTYNGYVTGLITVHRSGGPAGSATNSHAGGSIVSGGTVASDLTLTNLQSGGRDTTDSKS